MIEQIPIKQLIQNPKNNVLIPIESAAYQNLMEEIKKEFKPIPMEVMKQSNGYLIIDGNNRYSILKKIGYSGSVPCIVRDTMNEFELEKTIIKLAISRRNLSKEQIADLAKKLVAMGETQKEVSEKTGMSQANISYHTEKVLAARKQAESKAVELLCNNGYSQKEIAKKIGISERKVFDLAQNCKKKENDIFANETKKVEVEEEIKVILNPEKIVEESQKVQEKIKEISYIYEPVKKESKGLVSIFRGDYREKTKELEQGSYDLILLDPPYGVTNAKFDYKMEVSDIEEMLQISSSLMTEKGNLLIFCNLKLLIEITQCLNKTDLFLKQDLVWEKPSSSDFLCKAFRPMRVHEYILLISKSVKESIYNPKIWKYKNYEVRINARKLAKHGDVFYRKNFFKNSCFNDTGSRYPVSVLYFSNCKYNSNHPTQKPVNLIQYLIENFSNQNSKVIDFFAGSGSTGIGAIKAGRICHLIEIDENYCDIAENRIDSFLKKCVLDDFDDVDDVDDDNISDYSI